LYCALTHLYFITLLSNARQYTCQKDSTGTQWVNIYMSIVVIDDHTFLFLHVYNFNQKLNSQSSSLLRYIDISIIIGFYKYRLLDIEIFDISEYRYLSVLSISRLRLYI
jgi:molybdopterin-guanine dinucleotide biosynthesis protein